MKDKLISVVAPAYNHQQYIEKCIHSIINQTYECIELIIIDDNSNDSTVEIIEDIIYRDDVKKRFDNKIKFIKHKNNKGAHYSINQGLDIAEGDYLSIINTDDFYENDRFSIMIKQMGLSNSQFAFSKIDTVNNDDIILHNNESSYFKAVQNKINNYPYISMAIVTDNVAISTGNFLFTKNLYKVVGEFKGYKYIHDWDFFLRASLVTEPIYVPDTKYYYRLHSENSFKKLQKDLTLCYNESMNVLTNYFKRIIDNKFTNLNIPQLEVWEYFFTFILKNPDILHIWNLAKNTNKIITY